MNIQDLLNQRLSNQHLLNNPVKSPIDTIKQLGAVQSQDYIGAKWALAQRVENATDAEIDKLFNDGKILRTHVMRPTWHFIAPEDIRWLLKLTAPRVHAVSAYYYRQQGLTQDILKDGANAMSLILENNNYLTREQLTTELEKKGIITNKGIGTAYLIIYAELEQVICSGPKVGKQFTYALLEERVSKYKKLSYEESLIELTKRYFTTHGPAQLQDFAWWSGLSAIEIKKGIELLGNTLTSEKIDNKTYYYSSTQKKVENSSLSCHLLPNYDEYTIAYKDRSAFLDPSFSFTENRSMIFNHSIVVNGVIVGGWRRELKKHSVILTYKFFREINKQENQAFLNIANKYGEFLNKEVTFSEESK